MVLRDFVRINITWKSYICKQPIIAFMRIILMTFVTTILIGCSKDASTISTTDPIPCQYTTEDSIVVEALQIVALLAKS